MPYPDNFSDAAFDQAMGTDADDLPDYAADRDAIRVKIAELSALMSKLDKKFPYPSDRLDQAQGELTQVAEYADAAVREEGVRARDAWMDDV